MRKTNRQRGAIALEFLIICPLLILVWISIELFHHGYDTRMKAFGESQQQAWALAYPNSYACYQSGKQEGTTPSAYNEIPDDPRSQYENQTAQQNSLFKFGYRVDMTKTETFTTSGSVGGTRQTQGRTYLPCNEFVPTADKDSDVFTPLQGDINILPE